MIQNIIAVMALLTSLVVVFLNYWREVRTKRENEIYLRKTKFYEELIECLNRINYQEDSSHGRDFSKQYHKAFIYSNKEVIANLNDFLNSFRQKKILSFEELNIINANILRACRNDLGFKDIVEYSDLALTLSFDGKRM